MIGATRTKEESCIGRQDHRIEVEHLATEVMKIGYTNDTIKKTVLNRHLASQYRIRAKSYSGLIMTWISVESA